MAAASPGFVPVGVDPTAPLTEAARARLAATVDDRGLVASLVHRLRELKLDIDRMSCPRLTEQLLATGGRRIDLVVCNILDVDSTVRLNALVAATFGDELSLLARALASAVGADAVIFAADAALARPTSLAGHGARGERVTLIDNAYPTVHPTLLVRGLTGRTVMPGRLPVEQGVLLLDAAAAWTLARAAAEPQSAPPLAIGVRDHRSGRKAFATASAELRVSELLPTLCAPLADDVIILGGSKLLRRRVAPDARLSAADSILHICPAEEYHAPEPCVRCNWCADICPTGVLPMLALEAAQLNAPELAARAAIGRCLDCGLCDYVCPSRLPLVAAIRGLREAASATLPVGQPSA